MLRTLWKQQEKYFKCVAINCARVEKCFRIEMPRVQVALFDHTYNKRTLIHAHIDTIAFHLRLTSPRMHSIVSNIDRKSGPIKTCPL